MTDKSPTCILSSSCLKAPAGSVAAPTFVTKELRSSVVTSFYCNNISSSSGAQQQEQNPVDDPVSPSLSNNRCGCSPTNSSLLPPAIDQGNADESSNSDLTQLSPQKSLRASKFSGWKTSKFFSKSMTSGELLKGLKKLSLSSTNEEQDPKSLKSRISNFKKRSSCGIDDPNQDQEAIDKPGSKTPVLGDSGSQKNLQDDGIVCKKEDLKAIICSAARRIPLCSPSRAKKALRQTKSASFEPPDEKNKKEPVRRAGSEESRTRRALPSTDKEVKLPPPMEEKIVASGSIVTLKVEVVDTPTVILTEAEKPEPAAGPPKQEKKKADSCVSTVKWDECEVVDAVLIGDAIESFLKGSMTNSEKKVAFRKNSCEKKKS